MTDKVLEIISRQMKLKKKKKKNRNREKQVLDEKNII